MANLLHSFIKFVILWYRIKFYPKYWDTLHPYHTCPKICTRPFCYLLMCVKTAGWVANSVDLRSDTTFCGIWSWVYTVCSDLSVPILGLLWYLLFWARPSPSLFKAIPLKRWIFNVSHHVLITMLILQPADRLSISDQGSETSVSPTPTPSTTQRKLSVNTETLLSKPSTVNSLPTIPQSIEESQGVH